VRSWFWVGSLPTKAESWAPISETLEYCIEHRAAFPLQATPAEGFVVEPELPMMKDEKILRISFYGLELLI